MYVPVFRSFAMDFMSEPAVKQITRDELSDIAKSGGLPPAVVEDLHSMYF